MATFAPTNWDEDIELLDYEIKLLIFKLISYLKNHCLLSLQIISESR